MKKSNKSKGGFTLVETMMALGLFGLMSAGTIASLPKVREVVVKSERVQIASNLMNNQVESLRILPFDQIEEYLDEGGKLSSNYEIGDVSYKIECQLLPYEERLYGDNAIQARVLCEWKVNDNSFSERYWTLFMRDGLSDKAFNG